MIHKLTEEPTPITHLIFSDDFAVAIKQNGVAHIEPYAEAGPFGATTWFHVTNFDGEIIMNVNSNYVQVVGYMELE